MKNTEKLILKAKNFQKARINKAKKLFYDDIRAQALYEYVVDEFSLREDIEDAEESIKNFKEDLEEFQKMMDHDPYNKDIEKTYRIFRNRINLDKMTVFMKDIHGVIFNKEGLIYELTRIAVPYEAYAVCFTEDDVKEIFKQRCYDEISKIFKDVSDTKNLIYLYDGIVHNYIQKYQSEIFKVDKMIEFLLNGSEEEKYHRFAITTHPEDYFDDFDREDPLTYPTKDDMNDKIKDAIEYDLYSETLTEALINLVNGYGEDPSDYMMSLDEIIELIISKNTPTKLLKDVTSNFDIHIDEYDHNNRTFYIALLNKFDKQVFQ